MSSLVIDIGNTSTSIGYYAEGEVAEVGRCASRFVDAEVVTHLSSKLPVERVVIASVVPELNARWDQAMALSKLPKPLFVQHTLDLGVAIDYPRPEKIGADRLADAAAASRLLGLPAVVCDFGTALTFDVLEVGRGYTGGIICPGLPLMFDYLSEKTAQLPHVEPTKTAHIVGRNTAEAMQIGARVGYRGMVREILMQLRAQLEEPELAVCCTGGFAHWIFDDWDVPAVIDPYFTLKGIGIIGELNAEG